MSQFTLLQADVTANTPQDRALMKQFNLFGPPGIILFDREGHEATDARVIGFTPADEFLARLQTID
jgi:thiol:disulfide interchange protein DsbD